MERVAFDCDSMRGSSTFGILSERRSGNVVLREGGQDFAINQEEGFHALSEPNIGKIEPLAGAQNASPFPEKCP